MSCSTKRDWVGHRHPAPKLTALAPDIVLLLDRHFNDSSCFSELVNLADNFCRCCCKAKAEGLDHLLKFSLNKIQTDPFKFCDLFVIVEAVIGLMVEQENTGFLKKNVDFLVQLSFACLNGNWQESDFLSHCLKLLSTIYTASKVDLLAQPSFVMISDKLLNIFVEYNSYEARRDIIKFW